MNVAPDVKLPWGWRIRMACGGAILGVATSGLFFGEHEGTVGASVGFLVGFLISGRISYRTKGEEA